MRQHLLGIITMKGQSIYTNAAGVMAIVIYKKCERELSATIMITHEFGLYLRWDQYISMGMYYFLHVGKACSIRKINSIVSDLEYNLR